MSRCIIVSAGDFHNIRLEKEEGDFLIACDAGFAYCDAQGVLPDLIIGDFDSLDTTSAQVQRALAEIESVDSSRIVRLNTHKDDTDTLRAVREGFSRGYDKFILYGALGGARIDHTFANIQTLTFIKHHGGTGYIMEDNRVLLICENETVTFHRGNTGYFSVFSLTPVSKGVTIKGLMYETDHATITSDFPIGVSNEFIIDEQASVTVEEGTLLITVQWGD